MDLFNTFNFSFNFTVGCGSCLILQGVASRQLIYVLLDYPLSEQTFPSASAPTRLFL